MRNWLSVIMVALWLSLGASGDGGRKGLPSPGLEKKTVFIPPQSGNRIEWTYSWSRDPVTSADDDAGAGGVSTTCETIPKGPEGNSDIEASNLRVFSSPEPEENETPWFFRWLPKPDSN
jgi:hypothetical protein